VWGQGQDGTGSPNEEVVPVLSENRRIVREQASRKPRTVQSYVLATKSAGALRAPAVGSTVAQPVYELEMPAKKFAVAFLSPLIER